VQQTRSYCVHEAVPRAVEQAYTACGGGGGGGGDDADIDPTLPLKPTKMMIMVMLQTDPERDVGEDRRAIVGARSPDDRGTRYRDRDNSNRLRRRRNVPLLGEKSRLGSSGFARHRPHCRRSVSSICLAALPRMTSKWQRQMTAIIQKVGRSRVDGLVRSSAAHAESVLC
jgi:hypothetical protein